MRLPIRARLTAWYVLLLAVILTGVGAFVVLRLKADLSRDIDRSEESSVAEIAQGYRAEGNKEFYDVSGTVLRILPMGTSGAPAVTIIRSKLPALSGTMKPKPRSSIHVFKVPCTCSVIAAPSRQARPAQPRHGPHR